MATDLAQQFCALRDTYIEKQFGRLNDMQREAVFTTNGPLLILAGAGSGKTTVLVNRIANLIRFGSAHGSRWTPREVTEDDVKALRTAIMTGTDAPSWLDGMLRKDAVRSWNVMAITFTNKAAGELKERLRRMLGGEEGDEVFASTFHSACVRILRRWAEEIGYPRSFTIYDSDDSQRVMKAVYKELSVDDKFFPVKSAINQMSRWKDQLISPAEALKTPARDTKGALAAKVYAAYEKKLKEAGAFDFDDLIYQTVILLSEHEDVREFYQNKYKYLLVDEYQDTSVAQFRLVSLLTGPEKNICVVGDDDQSIYRFRGATIENILNFERIYKGTKTIRLEQNYRSTSNILNAANCVIQHNTERKGKTLWTKNGEGDKVQVYTAENEQDEASHIADVIGQHLKEGGHLADHAILYRMNAQSAPIESYFTRAGIPHKIVGGQRFNDRKEVKDIHSYMSIVANPGTMSDFVESSTSLRAKSAQRPSKSSRIWRLSRASVCWMSSPMPTSTPSSAAPSRRCSSSGTSTRNCRNRWKRRRWMSSPPMSSRSPATAPCWKPTPPRVTRMPPTVCRTLVSWSTTSRATATSTAKRPRWKAIWRTSPSSATSTATTRAPTRWC